jgi:hypothetical protein
MRLTAHQTKRTTPEIIALVELLTDGAAAQVHAEITQVFAGDWEKNCQLAREAIMEKLKGHPAFNNLP